MIRYIIVIGFFSITTFWIYQKYNFDNSYYDQVISDRDDLNFTQRVMLFFEREYILELEREEEVLNKYNKGEISHEEYNQYLNKKIKETTNQTNNGVEVLKQIYDPDNGIFSGIFKMASSPNIQKNKQIQILDKKIDAIIEDLNNQDRDILITRLSAIIWVPVGDETIDKQMSKYYQNKILVLEEKIKNSNF
tara:strand:+ start:221 stop:796 length:576 start_codon:yes stop_codon:yes gene_type:complete